MKFITYLLLSFSLVLVSTAEPPVWDVETDSDAFSFSSIYKYLSEVKAKLDNLEKKLESKEATPIIAFTASLSTGPYLEMGPFPVKTTLIFKEVISNFGNAYNPDTGIFTAPVKGIYFFSFNAYFDGTPHLYASLIRNGQFIVSVWDNAAVDTNDSATNSVVLQMEPEESVHVELFSGRVITDDIHHYSTFTGFLMSPL